LQDPLFTLSMHPAAKPALGIVSSLQDKLKSALETIKFKNECATFRNVRWLRNNGNYGGGWRYTLEQETNVLHSASLNISAVQYDENPEKKLQTAVALSAIIHPVIESLPSMHMHISLTALKDDSYSLRLMSDLNPAIELVSDTKKFKKALEQGMEKFPRNTSLLAEGLQQGDRYFYIPALDRTRGVLHFYLEGYSGESHLKDLKNAKHFGESIISAYIEILNSHLEVIEEKSVQGNQIQESSKLEYFTLYLFQVLSLDRGTISGLIVHNENDEGIMGSLPGYINISILSSWLHLVPAAQQLLVANIVKTLDNYVISEDPDKKIAHVSKEARIELADVVRKHYNDNPAALEYLARGDKLPPTVENHR
jgi:coproporphyrinogen III oxidase